jgi:hypothetical protein
MYLLLYWYFDDFEVFGIFSTPQKADEALEQVRGTFVNQDGWVIAPMILDEILSDGMEL